MRERVQKVAQEIGYRPDATLANLMAHLRAGQKTRFQVTLGFLNASEDPVILREIPTFREWVRGATERARELGDEFVVGVPGQPGTAQGRFAATSGEFALLGPD